MIGSGWKVMRFLLLEHQDKERKAQGLSDL